MGRSCLVHDIPEFDCTNCSKVTTDLSTVGDFSFKDGERSAASAMVGVALREMEIGSGLVSCIKHKRENVGTMA